MWLVLLNKLQSHLPTLRDHTGRDTRQGTESLIHLTAINRRANNHPKTISRIPEKWRKYIRYTTDMVFQILFRSSRFEKENWDYLDLSSEHSNSHITLWFIQFIPVIQIKTKATDLCIRSIFTSWTFKFDSVGTRHTEISPPIILFPTTLHNPTKR